jgi:hypothetical protein
MPPDFRGKVSRPATPAATQHIVKVVSALVAQAQFVSLSLYTPVAKVGLGPRSITSSPIENYPNQQQGDKRHQRCRYCK